MKPAKISAASRRAAARRKAGPQLVEVSAVAPAAGGNARWTVNLALCTGRKGASKVASLSNRLFYSVVILGGQA